MLCFLEARPLDKALEDTASSGGQGCKVSLFPYQTDEYVLAAGLSSLRRHLCLCLGSVVMGAGINEHCLSWMWDGTVVILKVY